jgi:hypothetical protein
MDHHVDGTQVTKDQATASAKSKFGDRGHTSWETTKGWEILVQCWKDGSSTWERMKDVKANFPHPIGQVFSTEKDIP